MVGQAVVTDFPAPGPRGQASSVSNALADAFAVGERLSSRGRAAYPSPRKVAGSADGQDVVLHLRASSPSPLPEETFRENQRRTDAQRTGTRRSVPASEDSSTSHRSARRRGQSDYHPARSHAAEELVEQFHGGWISFRPGNVYGPGDDVVSLLMNMVRTFPAVPVIDGGDDRFQPVWVEDLASAIAAAVERTDLHGRILEIAGAEQTSTNDIVNRLAGITNRNPLRVPVPGFVARAVSAIAQMAGAPLPVNEGQLTMLREGNVLSSPDSNALVAVFSIRPTTLDEGLKKLADAQPEQLPNEGMGALRRKRVWADISGSRLTPEELFERFRRNFDEATPGVMDAQTEPGTRCDLEPGVTLTMSLPLRGNIQVRVQEVTERKATLVTLRGHPLAGAVRFLCEQRGDKVRFETQVYDRPASLPDWFVMRTVGDSLQSRTWEGLIDRMIVESGGDAPRGIEHSEEDLDEDQGDLVEDWLRDLVMQRKRAEV